MAACARLLNMSYLVGLLFPQQWLSSCDQWERATYPSNGDGEDDGGEGADGLDGPDERDEDWPT